MRERERESENERKRERYSEYTRWKHEEDERRTSQRNSSQCRYMKSRGGQAPWELRALAARMCLCRVSCFLSCSHSRLDGSNSKTVQGGACLLLKDVWLSCVNT